MYCCSIVLNAGLRLEERIVRVCSPINSVQVYLVAKRYIFKPLQNYGLPIQHTYIIALSQELTYAVVLAQLVSDAGAVAAWDGAIDEVT